MYPLLTEILIHLRSNLLNSEYCKQLNNIIHLSDIEKYFQNKYCNNNTIKKNISFSLLSGHDTVIMPLLSALGVFNDPLSKEKINKNKLNCHWSPYASRIIFELYTPKIIENNKNYIFSSSAILKHLRHNNNANYYLYEPYVRILYNGQVITNKIDACHDYHLQFKNLFEKELIDLSLCPLSIIEGVIDDLLKINKDKLLKKPSYKLFQNQHLYDPSYQFVNKKYQDACCLY